MNEAAHAALVVNVGSSSCKISLARGRDVQQIDTGADSALEWTASRWQEFAKTQGSFTPEFVLHRFVHSGGVFARPTRIDAALRANLEGLVSLAPLHTKNALKIVDTVAAAFPLSTGIACFDTTFHETLPQAAFTYAIPSAWREEHGIRKYGFHGFAHDYADKRAREILGPSPVSKVLSCHLGSGASLAAIIDGVSFDTTMGFTPVDGLVMATRPGSVDPGALAWLLVNTPLRPSEMSHLLEHGSGLTGIAGHGDMQLIIEEAGNGNQQAVLTYEVWLHRLVGEMGRMIAVMGGVDLIVFGGGIGKHAWQARSDAVAALGFLNARIDPDTNRAAHEDTVISTPDSAVATIVLEAREDIAMLRRANAAGALHSPRSHVDDSEAARQKNPHERTRTTTERPTITVEHIDRIEAAENTAEEKIVNDSLLESGLLPLPDAASSAGPAPAP